MAKRIHCPARVEAKNAWPRVKRCEKHEKTCFIMLFMAFKGPLKAL